MGRTLPWKKQSAAADAAAGAARPGGGASKNASTSTSNVISSSPRGSRSPSSPSTPNPTGRTPATRLSPHPTAHRADRISDHGLGQESPADAPKLISESLMIPGLQHDDKWRMVEDEFVAMAHRLTAHLHAAEYQRLKKLAQDQNADAIQSLSRPVTAPMTNRVKRRHAVVSLKRSQATSISKARSQAQDADEDEVIELPWAGTNLEGLMDSPRRKLLPLTSMVSTASGTRAAALSRKDSASSPSRVRQSGSVQQTESPTTPRKRSVRFSQEQNEDENLEKRSVPWRPLTSHSSMSQSASKTQSSSNNDLPGTASAAKGRALNASLAAAQKPASAPVTSKVDDDSDSSVEIMFGKHFRERRNKKRVASSTPDPAKEESELSE